MAIPVKQEEVWATIKPRVIEEGKALLKLNFYRYKAYYCTIKHDWAAAEGRLADYPSVNEASLKQHCQRAHAQSAVFEKQLKTDLAYLETLEAPCLKADETYSLLMITKTRENIRDLAHYNQHCKPSLEQIDAAYENRIQPEVSQLKHSEQNPGKSAS